MVYVYDVLIVMFKSLHAFLCTYMSTCIEHVYMIAFIHMYIHTHSCMSVCLSIYMYIHTCIHTYIHTYKHMCIASHMSAYIHTCMSAVYMISVFLDFHISRNMEMPKMWKFKKLGNQ